jgi:hypothetical protein
VLGDNEGVEPTLLHRRAQPSWTNALVGDESCDTKLHTSTQPPDTDQRAGADDQARYLDND